MANRFRHVVVGAGVALLIGLAEISLPAQLPPTYAPSAGTGLILGQIVDAGSGRGIAGVLVGLAPAAPPAAPIGELLEARSPTMPLPAAQGARRTLTTSDGRFLFRDLPKGRFSITASAPAYGVGAFGQLRPQGPGQTIDLEEGGKQGGVTIKLWRNGSISGIVRDEAGEPAVGVNVECYRRVFTGGQKRYTSIVSSIFTDDRGVYRVPNLAPGDYICGTSVNPTTVPVSIAETSAAANDSGPLADVYRRMQNSSATLSASGVRVGELIYSTGVSALRGPMPPPPDGTGRIVAYAPQYFGGATTTAQATVISIKAGEDRGGVDIHVKLVPTVRLSGKLVGPEGAVPYFGLSLLPASGNDIVSEGLALYSRTTSDPSGQFTFLGIPGGEYVLKGRYYPRPTTGGNPAMALDEATLWVSTPITVGAADQTTLSIPVRIGIRAAGRVEFTGARTPPGAAEVQRIGVRLQMAEGRTSSPVALDGRVNADGSFKTAGYPAGLYIANVLPNTVPAGWFVKSITANGRDVSVEPLELANADITGMVVTFTDKTTTLTGSVTGANGPDATAEVVVFPADSMAWKQIGVVARRSRVERVSNAGTFSISGLPAGEYFVAAAAGSLAGDRQDPALLTQLMSGASRVTLADGGTANIQLTVKR